MPVVVQMNVYGALVSSTPSGAPSSRNWTPTTLTSSAASADSGTLVPDATMVPPAGPITLTVGAALSLTTVTAAVADIPVPPFESRATAAMKCVPFSVVVVSHGIEYGD